MHESEMPEREERELPGDADDSMEWLEDLAGDTGALWEDPPTEEPADSNKSLEDQVAAESSGWMDAESEMSEQESEPIPEWLIPHLETTELPVDEDDDQAAERELEQDTMVSAKIPAIPDSGDDGDDGDDGETEEVSEEQFADDLSWLDRIASGEGSAIEEPPTMRWGEPDADSDEEVPEQKKHTAAETPEVPEDADEAMAWLEKLATRQGAPSEELTMAEAPTAAEIPEADVAAGDVNFATIPEDPDEAVAWLEQLAAQQGAPDEELTTVQEETYDLVQEIAPAGDDELDSAIEELAGIAMPEDSDEALAWLGELADLGEAEPEMAAPDSGVAVVEEPPTPAVEHDVVAARAEAEILFAQQTVDAAEVPATAEPDVIPGEESDAGAEVVDVSETAETGADIAGSAELEAIGEQAVSEVPVGTDEDEVAAEDVEDLDWLDSLDEGDAVSWLESESIASEVELTESEEEVQAIADEAEAAELPPEEPALEAPEYATVEAYDIERLEVARSAVEAGDWIVAAKEYEALLDSGEGLPFLISDLETTVEVHEKQPILKRLLGDAYVRNGQLERAVDVYRQALDQL